MLDLLEDLKVRWKYHPTFQSNVHWFLITAVTIGVLGTFVYFYASATPECRRDYGAILDTSASSSDNQGSTDVAQACLDSHQ